MIKVKFKVKDIQSGDVWEETTNVSSLKQAEKELKQIVDKFNAEEEYRYGDRARPRKFICLIEREVSDGDG